MAKHRKKYGKSSKFFAYPIQVDLALGALAAGATIAGVMTAFGVTRVQCISADLTWSINNHTSTEGPIRVGLANGNLSVTEINEKLDARPTSQTDIIAMERSRRPVRDSGKFSGSATTVEVLNDGEPVRTTLKFPLNEGVELVAWARNEDTAAFTTGTIVHASGTLYMRWI